jgi:distribution and morphology protein 12
MSLDIDWSKLDATLANHVQQFLNKHFQSITKPSFIGDIQVTDFQWGNNTPQIEITNITDPFPEFYEQEDDEADQAQERDPLKSTLSPSSISSPTSRQTSSPTPSIPIQNDVFSDDGVGYNTARLSLNTPLSQQQRFNLMHSFHRSPFVAPQHPFNNNQAVTLPWQSHPSSVIEEDWIDDEEINPNISPSSLPNNTSNHSNTTDTSSSTEMDFQVHMLISYKGDMSMSLVTELRMNYPSMMFMSLPINLCVKSIEFEATCVVAYIQSMNRVCVSMLEPEEVLKGNGMDSLLRNVHIETVVGDEQKQGLSLLVHTQDK